MKTLLFTGASGFLGANTLHLLQQFYAVETLGITTFDTYNCNLAKESPALDKCYDVVLHAAGKAHVVPKTADDIKSFYDINYLGTINLCAGLEKCGVPKSLIFISTVAVYGCEEGVLITENFPLNGNSPYADSKKKAEKYIELWCCEKNVVLTILRPSLLAGKNPPGNLGAMINGISSGKYLSIAGGKSRKSIAMASDIARVIPLCEAKGGTYNLCDGNNPSFRELQELICSQLHRKKVINIPYILAAVFAFCGFFLGKRAPINMSKLQKITKSLTFSNKKIIHELNFTPSDVLENFYIK